MSLKLTTRVRYSAWKSERADSRRMTPSTPLSGEISTPLLDSMSLAGRKMGPCIFYPLDRRGQCPLRGQLSAPGLPRRQRAREGRRRARRYHAIGALQGALRQRSPTLEGRRAGRRTPHARRLRHEPQRRSMSSRRGFAISSRRRSKVQGHTAGTPWASRHQLLQPLCQIVDLQASLRSASKRRMAS